MAYMDWCLEGWRGAADAEQGYYSPTPDTARNYMTEDACSSGTRVAGATPDPSSGASRTLPTG